MCRKYPVFRAFAPCMVIIVLILAGCPSGGPLPDDGASGDDTQIPGDQDAHGDDGSSGGDLDIDPASLDGLVAGLSFPSDDDNPPVVYSSDLIRQAYDRGELTDDEYYLLSIDAVYNRDELDVAFQAERDPAPDTTSLLRLLRYAFDSLSPNAQDRLLPYTLSFDDPQSAFYDPTTPTAEELATTQRPRPLGRDMENPHSSGDYFVITGGTEAQREQVRDALWYSYYLFLSLGFVEPTDWVRVELQHDLGGAGILGEEVFHHLAGEVRCHIRLRDDLSGDQLDATTAHELFHCFQEYVEASPAVRHAPWVWESSAVWSQEFAYPTTNTEHHYDALAFSTLHGPFFDLTGVREYASYLFWFHLYQQDGKTGDAVHDLYVDIQENGTIEAIMGRPAFYEEFKEYALWMLNTGAYRFFEDTGGEPTQRPHGDSVQRTDLAYDETYTELVDLPEGGIMYYIYDVDPGVEKIRIDLADIQKNGENHNGIQLLYRVNGNWLYEDISYRDEVVFCRSREGEDVDAMIAIVSNGQLDASADHARLSADLVFETMGACTTSWHGYTECTWSGGGPGEGRGEDIWILGDYTTEGTTRVEETLLYVEENDTFYALEQTVTMRSRYEWYFEHVPPTVDASYTAWERRVEDKDGFGHFVHEMPDGCPPDHCTQLPYRIRGREQEDGTVVYTMREQSFLDLGTYLSVYSAYYVPGSLGIMQGHVAEVRTSENEHDIGVHNPSEPLEMIMSDDGLSMTGAYTEEGKTCKAEYRYE